MATALAAGGPDRTRRKSKNRLLYVSFGNRWNRVRLPASRLGVSAGNGEAGHPMNAREIFEAYSSPDPEAPMWSLKDCSATPSWTLWKPSSGESP